jgi:hypothetical protein
VNTGKAIRKFLFISVWLMIGGGMVTLLLAAIGKQKKDQCRDYSIIIKTAKQNSVLLMRKMSTTFEWLAQEVR